nr:hypothetical protein [Bifidobacterium canis]
MIDVPANKLSMFMTADVSHFPNPEISESLLFAKAFVISVTVCVSQFAKEFALVRPHFWNAQYMFCTLLVFQLLMGDKSLNDVQPENMLCMLVNSEVSQCDRPLISVRFEQPENRDC